MNIYKAKQEIIRIGQLLWKRNMVAANEGNLSIRLDDGTFLITPSGLSKGFLEPDNLIHLDKSWQKKNQTQLNPTSEGKLHRIIYENSAYNAVCHSHPVYATSFSASNKGLPSCLLPEIILSIGAIPLVPYAHPSTEGVGKNLLPFLLDGYEVFLLQNHGVVTVGEDLQDAYLKMETVEQYAAIVHNSLLRNDIKFLSRDEIEELNRIRREIWKKRGFIICDSCNFCKIIKEGKHD